MEYEQAADNHWDIAHFIAFLLEYSQVLHPRVEREVNNKLATGLKNPGKAHRRNHEGWKRRVGSIYC